ncbi:MAG: 3-methyl-2-oxobutanoate dehydrogenase subunit VorB [Firmicutes bacterium]|nr:3-methyl-2-oxobutanoate dehydrogenase subunit VorB [Bacillota bacterium]
MKMLMKGNEAIGEAAIRAGCHSFFGYPITPQTELSEYLAKRLPQVGGVFLQAESEVAAINMVYGAAGAGARVMTSSSGPGISLKAEGISYLAGSELPCVIVNIMRGGPGLGSIQPSQSDYFQATRGGGHGDYRVIVLAPATVQEMADLTADAFDLADRYRNPVLVLGDGILGQMMEAVEFKPGEAGNTAAKNWATTGCRGRERNIINSLYLAPERLEQHNRKLQEKYKLIEKREPRAETYLTGDAEIIVVAFGTASRIARTAVDNARTRGVRAGLIRPITLWPFPELLVREALGESRAVLTVEMNAGQMLDDVRLAVNGLRPVFFYGRTGGMVPGAAEILHQIVRIGGMNCDGQVRQA